MITLILQKLLDRIGSKFKYTFYQPLMRNISVYENDYETPHYIQRSDNDLLFKFLLKIITHINKYFTFDEVKKCVKGIYLCNIVAKSSNNTKFLKKIDKYLNQNDWITLDTYDFIPILDAAKYCNIHVFNYVYDRTVEFGRLYQNDYGQNILDLSLLNSDIRVLKKLLYENYNFSEFHILTNLYASKKIY